MASHNFIHNSWPRLMSQR